MNKRFNLLSLESASPFVEDNSEQLLTDGELPELPLDPQVMEEIDLGSAAAATRDAVINAPSEEAALECYKLFLRTHGVRTHAESMESAVTRREMVASLEGVMRSVGSFLRNTNHNVARFLGRVGEVFEAKVSLLNQISGKHNQLLRKLRIDGSQTFDISGGLAKSFYMPGVNKGPLEVFAIDLASCRFMLVDYPKAVRDFDAAAIKVVGKMVREGGGVDAVAQINKAPTPIAKIPNNIKGGHGFMQGGSLVCSKGDFTRWVKGPYLAKLEFKYESGRNPVTSITVTQSDVVKYVKLGNEMIDVITENLTQYRRMADSMNTAWSQLQNVLANAEDFDDAAERFDLIKTLIGNSYRGTRTNYHCLNHAYRSASAMSKLIDKLLA